MSGTKPGHRSPIHVIGDPIRKGVTWLSDELIREGAHEDALGSDGFVVIAFMLSCASAPDSNRKAYETSPLGLSKQFNWGRNRVRAMRALKRAEKDNRLVIRRYVHDGRPVPRKPVAYVVCAGGRRFTDAELSWWSRPIEY
jgi:hypothetical protein